jgi:predicted acetyltransferase
VQKKEHWKILLEPDYLNFLPTYKRLLEMGATDQMVYEGLAKALENEFLKKISPRLEYLFRVKWLLNQEEILRALDEHHIGDVMKLSRNRRSQLNKKAEKRLCLIKYPSRFKIRVKESMYHEILEKIMQQK